MPRLVKASGYKGKMIVASAGVKARTMIDEDEGGKKITDPHAWQDLSNGKLYVTNIEKALSQADPAGAEIYKANAAAYLKKIDDMDAWVKAEFAKVQRAQRKVITSHDAFGYFGAAYGVTLMAPMGFSTESEASAKNVGKLIRQIKKEKVKALFFENMSDPRLIDRIAKETGTTAGGPLFSDALSAPDGPAPNYLAMFTNNIGKMVSAMLSR
jgi:zinc/manganese transport system substrate-binding protein